MEGLFSRRAKHGSQGYSSTAGVVDGGGVSIVPPRARGETPRDEHRPAPSGGVAWCGRGGEALPSRKQAGVSRLEVWCFIAAGFRREKKKVVLRSPGTAVSGRVRAWHRPMSPVDGRATRGRGRAPRFPERILAFRGST